MEITPPIILLLSFIFGGLIGLERQFNERGLEGEQNAESAVVGFRTFSLISVLGALAGLLYSSYFFIAAFIGLTFFSLMLFYYREDSKQTNSYGVTTELAMVYSFLIGALLAIKILPVQLILAISVILLLLLSQKQKIHALINRLNAGELNAFISYAVVALVILPFLPNETYAVSDIPFVHSLLNSFDFPAEKLLSIEVFNPFKIWLVVALITGIDMLGYILERTLGTGRGWILASIAGGFISSTATTQSLAQQSKQTANVSPLLAAAIVANLASFFQITLVLLAVNAGFFMRALPTILLLIVSGTAVTLFFFLRKETKKGKERAVTAAASREIFNLAPALTFAMLFLLITIISKLSLTLFGNGAFLVTTALGALAGLDAVMINTAELAGKAINYQLAVIALLIANAVNLTAKVIYSFVQGKQSFAIQLALGLGVIILVSSLGLFFV